eukprot:3956683-Amphidinium_carterae.2
MPFQAHCCRTYDNLSRLQELETTNHGSAGFVTSIMQHVHAARMTGSAAASQSDKRCTTCIGASACSCSTSETWHRISSYYTACMDRTLTLSQQIVVPWHCYGWMQDVTRGLWC